MLGCCLRRGDEQLVELAKLIRGSGDAGRGTAAAAPAVACEEVALMGGSPWGWVRRNGRLGG